MDPRGVPLTAPLSLSLRPRCILGQRYCESCCHWPLPTVIIYPAPVSLGSASHLFSPQGLFKLLSLSPCTISSTFTCQLNCLFSESQTFLLFSLLTRTLQLVLSSSLQLKIYIAVKNFVLFLISWFACFFVYLINIHVWDRRYINIRQRCPE